MITRMREPPDQFAQFLRRLRRERGVAADCLSIKAGKTKTYIGVWERNAKAAPNRDTLLRVADALQLSEGERRRLFQLADLRTNPEDAQRWYDPGRDILRNIQDALFADDVEHELAVTPTESATRSICEAVSWVLASYGASQFSDFTCDLLKWPERIYRERIFDPQSRSAGKWDIPAQLIQEELPQLDAAGALTQESAYGLAHGLAAVYRRWFFADPDRCKQAVSAILRWGYDHDPDVGPIVYVTFRGLDEQNNFGVTAVRCDVVETVARRDLADTVWCLESGLPENAPLRACPVRLETVDLAALFAFTFAKRYLASDRGRAPWPLFQSIRDALYVVTSGPWLSEARGFHGQPGASLRYSLASMIETGKIENVPPPGTTPAEAFKILFPMHGMIVNTLREAETAIYHYWESYAVDAGKVDALPTEGQTPALRPPKIDPEPGVKRTAKRTRSAKKRTKAKAVAATRAKPKAKKGTKAKGKKTAKRKRKGK